MPRTGVNTRPPITDAERAEAIVLYSTGLGLLQVAELVGRSYGAVHGVIYRAGIMRGRKELPPGADELILGLWQEHRNVTKIAELLPHCRSSIMSSLARSGVTIPPQRADAVTADERARMVELYVGERKTIQQVAAATDRSTSAVYRALVKADVVRSQRKRDA